MVSLISSPRISSTGHDWQNSQKRHAIDALLFSDDPAMAAAIASDIEAVFGAAPARRALDGDADNLHITDCDLVFLQCDGAGTDALALLQHLASIPIVSRPAIIVQSSLEIVDDLFAQAEAVEADVLIGPDAAERIVALTTLMQRSGAGRSGLREDGDETAEELRRLSEQMAGFAEQINQMRDAISGLPSGDMTGNIGGKRLASPEQGFAGPMQGYDQGLAASGAGSAGASKVAAAQIRQLIAHRRMRDAFFSGDLFADPAWDILLDLYAAHLERVTVSVSSLCIAAAVPPTTALRWVKLMTRSALLERRPDSDDRRRVHIVLSQSARTAMHEFFTKVEANGGSQGLLSGL